MKKLWGIVAVLVFLVVNAGEVKAAIYIEDYPRELALFKDGMELPAGAALSMEPGSSLYLDAYAKDVTGDGQVTWDDYAGFLVSGDLGVTIAMNPNLSTQNGVNVFYNIAMPVQPADKLGTFVITTSQVVDTIVSFQIVYTDNNTSIGHPTGVTTLRLQTGPVTDLFYLFVPKSMSLVNENGNKISSIRMEASRTRTLYAAADDYNQDGVIDALDYDVYPVNSLQMKPTIETDDEAVVTGTSTNPSLTGLTPTLSRYPTRIATVNLKAMNEGGDEGSDYPIRYTEVSYQIEFNGTTGSGINLQNILPDSGKTQTPKVSVAVTALDDAGGGSDGGGTCNAVGLGAFLFLVPLALFRRKSA